MNPNSLQLERSRRARRTLEMIHRYSLGEPVEQIADDYECGRFTVQRYARMAGLPKRPKGFPDEIRRATISLYKQGKPIAEIQARLGVSQAYVSKTATEEGINRRKFARG